MKEKRILGLDIFKLMASLFVIGIHTYFLRDISETYYLCVNYFFRVAVPFFFVCSGFFYMNKIKSKERSEVKEITKKYLKNILRVWLIWGMVYFTIATVTQVINGNGNVVKIIARQLIKAIFSTPGGGLWYVNALIYVILSILIFYKSDKDLKKLTIVYGIFYIFGRIWELPCFSGSFIGTIYENYMKILSSNRFFLFYGIFFMLGMNISRYYKDNISQRKKIIILIISFVLYGISDAMSNNNIVLVIIAAILRVVLTVFLFLVASGIKIDNAENNWLVNNSAKMSHIIYFTGTLCIEFVTSIENMIGLDSDNLLTITCIICWIILLSYSTALLKSKVGNKIYKIMY